MHYVGQPLSKARAGARDPSRLQSLTMIAIFDIAGPLVTYSLLRSAGFGAATALVISGAFPAIGVGIGLLRTRRLDAIGVLVLAGILAGTALGLVTGNARLVLVEGSVPTAVFGVFCLGSLGSARPLIYRFALEFVGTGTPRGQELLSLWQFAPFRRLFRVMTIVWGAAFLAEAGARVIIVEVTSAGTALAASKVMPYAVAGVLVAWMLAYSNWFRRRGERRQAQAAASGQASSPPEPNHGPASTAGTDQQEPL